MSSKRPKTTAGIETDRETGDTLGTVQLLVADTGNRTAIRQMLDDHFDVETSQTVRDADLYLIEDHLFPEYREPLREQVERAHPAFCPVVLIRRQTTGLTHPARDVSFHEKPILIDDVVDAPIDRALLIRRLHSLLVRHRQSQELSSHVSALEEREQELRRFERGVESTGNGIVMTDRRGVIDYVNPAFEGIAGYTESEVLGETPRVLQPAGAADVFTDEFWGTMVEREEWTGEVVIEHSDETRSVVDTSITAIHDGDGSVEGFVIVLNDITERIAQEQELQRREGELELLRQILTRYLRHNLRNDLNVILGYGEMVASDETLSDSQVQMAERIVETAQRLREKSDTARQYSTLLQQDVELLSYDLSEVVRESIRTISERYPDVVFDIEAPETCEVRARTGIRDAVEELIENAAKHNDAVSPHVHIQLRDSNGARLVIEDNGPGVSELELETLKEGKETPLSHSQGIGLWLSKWVIESVDGHLSFDRLDPGTRVTVGFPPPERIGSRGLDIPTLKERDQRLQTVIDRMTDAIIEVNTAWEITLFGASAEDILGVSADEVLGRDLWAVFSNACGTQFEDVFRDVMNARTSQHVEAYYPGIDGWMSVYVYPEFDGGLSFYFRETTERNKREQELQQARSRMELALRVTDSTVWEWDVETDSITSHPEPHGVFGTDITTGDEFLDALHPEDRAQVQEALETAIETKTPYSAEYRVQRGDAIRWIEGYGELPRDEAGGSERLIGVARDITERKEREQQLRERVKELTTIQTTTQILESMTTPLDELLSEFVETIPQSFQDPTRTAARLTYGDVAVATAAFESRPQMLTAQTDLSDGSTLRIEVAYLGERSSQADDPFLDEEQELLDTLVSILKGFIERRTYLREIEQTEELLTNAERLGRVGAWEIDLETESVHWTEGARRIFEISDGRNRSLDEVLEFVSPEDRNALVELANTSIEMGDRFEYELQIETAAGNERWIQIEGEPAERNDGTIVRGYIQDITERKERTRRYEAIFNQTYQFTGLMEPDGTLIEANETALEFGGVSREDVIGEKIWNAHWFEITEETQKQTKADVQRAAAGAFIRRELEVQGADDTTLIDFSIRPITDEDGTVVLLVPEGRDISDLKERERQLRREQQFVKSIFDALPDPLYAFDTDGNLLRWNEQLETVTGYSGAELEGIQVTELVPAEDTDAIEEGFNTILEDKQSITIESAFETKDGDRIPYEFTGGPLQDTDGTLQGVTGIGRDISKRRTRDEDDL